MFEIINGIIKLTQGDSAIIKVDLKNQNGMAYTMQTGDVLKFTVKETLNSSIALVKVSSNATTISLSPEQTKKLKPGKCFYEIQLQTEAGDVYTLLSATDIRHNNMIVYKSITE